MKTYSPKFFSLDYILTSGLSDHQDLELRRKVALFNVGHLIGVTFLLLMSVSAFRFENPHQGVINLFISLLLILNLVYLKKSENFRNATIVSTIFIGLLFFYTFITGGVKGTGHLWFLTFPLVTIFLLGSRQGVIATFLLGNTALIFTALDTFFPTLVSYSSVFKVRFFTAFAVIFALTFLFEKMREVNQGKLNNVNITLEDKIDTLEHTQQALRESEATHREVVEKASDGIAIIQDFRLKFVNPQMLAMVGYTVDSLPDLPFVDFFHPDEKEKIISYYQARARGEEVENCYESVLKHKNGNDIDVEVNISLISYHNQPSTLTIVRDINLRKAIENEHLEARRVAEEANQAKSYFLANMSHELRTPLNHIIGFTDLVRGENCGSLNDKQREFLGDVSQSSHHLLAIVNDILDLSKIEAKEMTVEKGYFNLENLLEQSLTTVREQAKAREIKLTAIIEKDTSLDIIADERKLKQILVNLLANAVKFTPNGGTITITAAQITPDSAGISLPAHDETSTNWLELTIDDTGIGIEAQDQEKIFSSFQQVDNSTTREFQGTGLGLTLTKHLVELQGGHIRVASDGKGCGSRFTITIPLIDNI